MFCIELFLQFAIRYLNTFEYLESAEVVKAMEGLLENFINKLCCLNFCTLLTDVELKKYNSNVLKIKAYGVGIVCRLQKYRKWAPSDTQQIEAIIHDLIKESMEITMLVGDGDCQDSCEEVLEIILEALK
jgi:hypothetical protein